MSYKNFLASKTIIAQTSGIDIEPDNPHLYDFQRAITAWALRKGRAAIFADCGLGKTIMQLVWAAEVHRHTSRPVLILAPLAVAAQTVVEGEKFGIHLNYKRYEPPDPYGITITNYEMLKNFSPERYAGVVLDESSILKSFSGKIRNQIISAFRDTPYRLACTATPAPNDLIELSNHSEFLGIMRREEMLATFFYHDSGNTSQWRVKGHAEQDFWKWVCSWAVMLNSPADLGFSNNGFDLPQLIMHEVSVPVDGYGDYLFTMGALSLQERIRERSRTVSSRAAKAAEIISENDVVLTWCNLNSESTAVKRASGSTEIVGSEKAEAKSRKMLEFSSGKIKKLVTKPSIAGFGMNWQHCNNIVFMGLSDSYEQFYQAVRRCWRYGQQNPVHVYVVIAETEGEVLRNIKRKEEQAHNMRKEMVANMADITKKELGVSSEKIEVYSPEECSGDEWTLYNGDCVEVMKKIESDSIGYSIFSPPFLSLYSYSDSTRDMGNSRTDEEFYNHFSFFASELFRVMQPGRNFSFHVANVPLVKWKHGVIGLRDFRGQCIRIFHDVGFIFHSEVCIWKDPVTAMQRTKALGLLYKQLKKDSAMSRQGIPDYLVTMKKWGENALAIEQKPEDFPLSKWQRYASPVWMDINQTRTLQYRQAREHKDEKHICPLQLDVIERGLELWSRPGDLVLSPFAGIGSEGHVAVSMGREFIGIELKKSYYRLAAQNLRDAELKTKQQFLF